MGLWCWKLGMALTRPPRVSIQSSISIVPLYDALLEGDRGNFNNDLPSGCFCRCYCCCCICFLTLGLAFLGKVGSRSRFLLFLTFFARFFLCFCFLFSLRPSPLCASSPRLPFFFRYRRRNGDILSAWTAQPGQRETLPSPRICLKSQ